MKGNFGPESNFNARCAVPPLTTVDRVQKCHCYYVLWQVRLLTQAYTHVHVNCSDVNSISPKG